METHTASQVSSADRLRSAALACARAEFVKWSSVLAFRATRVSEIEDDEAPMFRRMAINAIATEIGLELHLSENQVWRIIAQGERVRDDAPAMWAAFADGRVDVSRVSILASVLDDVSSDHVKERIDAVVVDYAVSHTPAELRRWLNKLIARLEPRLVEAEEQRADRHVAIWHTRDGMSWLNAYIPTPAAIAIGKRLRLAAKNLTDEPETPVRTRDQKQADLFMAWLTNAEGTDCDVAAEIAVTIEAATLAGVTDAPAIIDGEFAVPAAWILELAEANHESTLWTRLITDQASRVLDATFIGYQPPASLRKAIRWRDMTCRVSGCHRPAADCDIDHVKPFDAGGKTTASNLRSLCRRHHGLKGHGLLPADAYDKAEIHTTRLPRPPIRLELHFAA